MIEHTDPSSTISPTDAYDGDFYAKYQHLKGARPEKLEEMNIRHFGYMMDTFVDMLQAGLLSETVAKIPTDRDPTTIKPDPLPPSYIYDYFGDYRIGTSFFRPDKHAFDETEPAKADPNPKGVSGFAHKVHGESRLFGRFIFKEVEWPPAVVAIQEKLDELVRQYHASVKQHGNRYTQIPKLEMAQFNKRTDQLLGEAEKALSPAIMPTLTVIMPLGERVEIENRQPLHPNLPQSSTANALFEMKNAAKSLANLQRVPPSYAKHSMITQGAESIITDIMQGLMDQLSPDGARYAKILTMFRNNLKERVSEKSRELAILGLYQRTLDSAYPLAYDDLDRLLHICAKPDSNSITNLENQNEVAVMLYAAAKRLQKLDLPANPPIDDLKKAVSNADPLAQSLITLASAVDAAGASNYRATLQSGAATLEALARITAERPDSIPLARVASLLQKAAFIEQAAEVEAAIQAPQRQAVGGR